jgi:hypothetical protein
MRDTGVVRKRTNDAGAPYIPMARLQLGILKNLMALGEIQSNSRSITLDNGVVIHVSSVMGQDTIKITVPESLQGQEEQLFVEVGQPDHFKLYCALSTDGYVAYSKDGIGWVVAPLPKLTTNWVSIASNDSSIMAVSSDGYYAMTRDGMTWRTGTIPLANIRSVAKHGGAWFVVANADGKAAYQSANGWTVIDTAPTSPFVASNGASVVASQYPVVWNTKAFVTTDYKRSGFVPAFSIVDGVVSGAPNPIVYDTIPRAAMIRTVDYYGCPPLPSVKEFVSWTDYKSIGYINTIHNQQFITSTDQSTEVFGAFPTYPDGFVPMYLDITRVENFPLSPCGVGVTTIEYAQHIDAYGVRGVEFLYRTASVVSRAGGYYEFLGELIGGTAWQPIERNHSNGAKLTVNKATIAAIVPLSTATYSPPFIDSYGYVNQNAIATKYKYAFFTSADNGLTWLQGSDLNNDTDTMAGGSVTAIASNDATYCVLAIDGRTEVSGDGFKWSNGLILTAGGQDKFWVSLCASPLITKQRAV